MADKETRLSIVLRTVDRATAGLRAVNAKIAAITKPMRDFKEALGGLKEESGIDALIGGFKGVGSAIVDLLGKLAMIGGAVGVAIAGLFHLVDGFDELGDKAEILGVDVDFLAQMRAAAEVAGGSVEALDSSFQGFSKSLGQARAGTGRMASFLQKVYPPLLKQLKATKSNEEAFDLLADTMSKLKDPAKRAALAAATGFDPSLVPLLQRGAGGVKELRDEYAKSAGSMKGAVDAAGEVDGAMHELKAATDGVKAALVTGLAPALKQIVQELAAFFSENRERIAEWSKELGKKLPGMIHKFADGFLNAIDVVQGFVERIGGVRTVAIALAAILAGPLVSAVVSLGVALLTTPVGWVLSGLAAIVAAVALCSDGFKVLIPIITTVGATLLGMPGVAIVSGIIAAASLVVKYWEPIKAFFAALWDGITDVFEAAWGVIKGIVDAIVGAVETVVNAVGALTEGVGIERIKELQAQQSAKPAPDPFAQAAQSLQAVRSSSEARVTLDFNNLPRSATVRTDPKNTADVDLSVGYQLGVP